MVQFFARAFQHRCCCTIPTPSVFLSFCLSVFLSFCFSVFLSFCFSVRIVQFIARAFQHLCCTIPTPSGNCRQARHQQTSSPPFIGEIINYPGKSPLKLKRLQKGPFCGGDHPGGKCVLSSRLKTGFISLVHCRLTGIISLSFGAIHISPSLSIASPHLC